MENCPYPPSSQQYICLLEHTFSKQTYIEELQEIASAPQDPSKMSCKYPLYLVLVTIFYLRKIALSSSEN